MNRVFAVVALLLVVSTATNAVADDLEYELGVEGMVCAFCAYNVSRALRSLEGVVPDSIDVDLASGRITLRSSAKLEEAVLAGVVQDAGFELEALAETEADSPPVAPAGANRRVLVSLTLDVDGLKEGEFDALLEAVGQWAAERRAGLAVAGPAAIEMRALRPILMGHTPALDVDFTEAIGPDNAVLINVLAD